MPGRESDTELERAILGHEYTEPIRWQKPNVLVLERHEYYEKLKPTAIGDVKFESIHGFDRLYFPGDPAREVTIPSRLIFRTR